MQKPIWSVDYPVSKKIFITTYTDWQIATKSTNVDSVVEFRRTRADPYRSLQVFHPIYIKLFRWASLCIVGRYKSISDVITINIKFHDSVVRKAGWFNPMNSFKHHYFNKMIPSIMKGTEIQGLEKVNCVTIYVVRSRSD